MSKVTSKRQVTIPKEVADRYRIEPGDEIRWVPSGDEIRVIPPGSRPSARLGVEQRLALFDRATERREGRGGGAEATGGPTVERGWTRSELYERGRTR
jgi:AbrB family looped-hinge helix DNA binding protein